MRVSAIIPVFNRAATVGAALRSILDQPSVPLEVVVVDDGSADDLAGALAPFAGAPLRVIRHPANAGAAAARNTGIAAASGEWIALLDSDDVWLPTLLAELVPTEDRGARALAQRLPLCLSLPHADLGQPPRGQPRTQSPTPPPTPPTQRRAMCSTCSARTAPTTAARSRSRTSRLWRGAAT